MIIIREQSDIVLIKNSTFKFTWLAVAIKSSILIIFWLPFNFICFSCKYSLEVNLF